MHTFSESAVEIMVRAGVDSVEHGTGLSLDLIDEMARRGTALVPTMINIATFGGIAEQARGKFPGYAEHMLALRDGFPEVVRAAYEAGVPIYVGTDAGGGIDHGLAAEEMLLLHEQAGMAPIDVLAAASWGARRVARLPRAGRGRPRRPDRLPRRPPPRPARRPRPLPHDPARPGSALTPAPCPGAPTEGCGPRARGGLV